MVGEVTGANAFGDGKKKFAGVNDIGGKACPGVKVIHKIEQGLRVPGIATKMILREKQGAGVDGCQCLHAFENGYADNRLIRAGCAEEAEEGGACADGAGDMGVAGGVGEAEDIFASFDTGEAAAAFRNDV